MSNLTAQYILFKGSVNPVSLDLSTAQGDSPLVTLRFFKSDNCPVLDLATDVELCHGTGFFEVDLDCTQSVPLGLGTYFVQLLDEIENIVGEFYTRIVMMP